MSQWHDNPTLRQITWSRVTHQHDTHAAVTDGNGRRAILRVRGNRWFLLHADFGFVIAQGAIGAIRYHGTERGAQKAVYLMWRRAVGLGLFELPEAALKERLAGLPA